MDRPIVMAPTTRNSFRGFYLAGSPINGNLVCISLEIILALFPHVATHVIDPQLVWGFLAYFMGSRSLFRVFQFPQDSWIGNFSGVVLVPADCIDIIAATKMKAVFPIYAIPCGIFPFRFRRQAKGQAPRVLLFLFCPSHLAFAKSRFRR